LETPPVVAAGGTGAGATTACAGAAASVAATPTRAPARIPRARARAPGPAHRREATAGPRRVSRRTRRPPNPLSVQTEPTIPATVKPPRLQSMRSDPPDGPGGPPLPGPPGQRCARFSSSGGRAVASSAWRGSSRYLPNFAPAIWIRLPHRSAPQTDACPASSESGLKQQHPRAHPRRRRREVTGDRRLAVPRERGGGARNRLLGRIRAARRDQQGGGRGASCPATERSGSTRAGCAW
jgi:hypothetical protein